MPHKLGKILTPSMIGERNPNWNGGTSEYKYHAYMKRQRKRVIARCAGKCERCHDDGNVIHHIDGSKDTHELGNLLFLCFKCHAMMHPGMMGRPSKYKIQYGYTVAELAMLLNMSQAKIYYFGQKDVLWQILWSKGIDFK